MELSANFLSLGRRSVSGCIGEGGRGPTRVWYRLDGAQHMRLL